MKKDTHENWNKYSDLVNGQTIDYIESFTLESGKVITNVPVAYKTWGKLDGFVTNLFMYFLDSKTNCIILCHALSGSCDVEDWWGPLLGPKKTFDSEKFFIFSANILGSPYGSASPCTIDPKTGKNYGPHFPMTTIRDDANIHKLVLDRLGVKSVKFVIGGSMGGMLALEWYFCNLLIARSFFGTDYIQNIVAIATSGRHSAWCISWGEAQRQSIYSDPKYANGDYEMSDPPASGLSAARMAAMLTYRSRNSFEARFGRKLMPSTRISVSSTTEEAVHNDGNKFRLPLSIAYLPQNLDQQDNEFSVYTAQSYLRYQGDKFINRFDANCYISITRKMDSHDISRGRGEYEDVLRQISQPCLIIGIASDGLFTVEEQHELGSIPCSQVVIIESGEGHDGFLLEFVKMRALISAFIRERAQEYFIKDGEAGQGEQGQDSEIISVPKKASIFGEAEGDLLLW